MIFSLFKKKKPPRIPKETAIMIARQKCVDQGWPWLEPINISTSKGKWIIETNYHARGARVRIVIDQYDEKIETAAFLAR